MNSPQVWMFLCLSLLTASSTTLAQWNCPFDFRCGKRQVSPTTSIFVFIPSFSCSSSVCMSAICIFDIFRQNVKHSKPWKLKSRGSVRSYSDTC